MGEGGGKVRFWVRGSEGRKGSWVSNKVSQ